MLVVERNKADWLPLTLDTIEASGEVAGEAQPNGELVACDQQIRQLRHEEVKA